MVNLNGMKDDTERIIAEWSQTVTIKRLSAEPGSFGQTEGTWETVQQNGEDTINCDIQPGGSALIRDKKGEQHSVDYKVFLPFDADVQQGDRIIWDSITMVVERIDSWQDHIRVYANRWK
jgi:hypothetical protein